MKASALTIRNLVLTVTLATAVCASWSVAVWAVDLPSADLPPESDPVDCGALISHYWGAGLSFTGPDGSVVFDGISLQCFAGPVQRLTLLPIDQVPVGLQRFTVE